MLAALYDAAVAGAAPGPLTTAALRALPLSGKRVHLFALGKAAPAMASAAVGCLHGVGAELAGGVIVAAAPARSPHPALASLEGDHPLPGARSFEGARTLAERVSSVRNGDVAIVLLSGGATSLVAAPIAPLAETDIVALFELLHRSGLDIHAMNVVRKRFTMWGAGRLAVALAPANVHVFIVSDVPGDDPADVASGPCAPDPTRAEEVLALLRDAALLGALPAAMREHLALVQRGDRPETPKATHPAFAGITTRVIGSNRLALDAVVSRARELSLHAEILDVPLAGEAAERGAEIAEALLARAAEGWRGCLVWGGETTVARASDGDAPAGGRCQELALAAARRLASGTPHADHVMLLAAGTDGRDGPTDAAGAFADAGVWDAIARRGGEPERALARHASYDALDSVHALLKRGLTGTNVMDVVIGVVGERALHAR